MLMGGEQLAEGPLKIMLDDYVLPDIDAFRKRIIAAHERGRPVAVHCVTRTELVFAVSTLLQAGTISGDRIEHASVTDDLTMELIVRSGLTVVTQPNLILERGSQYLDEVNPTDHPYLYRCRGFLDAGVPLGGGTDAPFGRPDPWAAMRAAVMRQTADGRVIGECEALTPQQALALFASHPEDPGGPGRRIAPGEAADLCLLKQKWSEARHRLRSDDVAATILGGVVTFEGKKLT
jgi:predicted amidohydrolase YtcJ